MTPPAHASAQLGRFLAPTAVACVASCALCLLAGLAIGQVKGAWPAAVSAIAQTMTTVAGVPTLLTISGTGSCKFRLSYQKLGGTPVASAQLVFSSTPQNPFPLQLKIMDATAPGTYTWTASGMDGCLGSQSLTFTVR